MRMSVGVKLFAGFAAVLVLNAAVVMIALYHLAVLNGVLEELYSKEFGGVRELGDVKVSAMQFRGAMMLAVLAEDRAERERELMKRKDAETSFTADVASLRTFFRTQKGISLLGQFETAWAQYKQSSDQVVAALTAGNQAEAERLLRTTGSERLDRVLVSLTQLSDHKAENAADAKREADRIYADARNLVVTLLAIAVLASVLMSFWLARALGKSLGTMAETAALIAEGDLTRTVDVRSRDEVGELGASFNRMVARLRELTSEIQQGAQSLSAATSEIVASVTQQASSTSEQATAVSQTTATIDEVRAVSQQANQKAQAVAAVAQQTADIATAGLGIVETTVGGLQNLRGRVESIAEQILTLSEQTQQIGEIIATVEDLADQSNLLAVNAAIEASRAGEQGRGFAVVAQEVRGLAERAKAATVQVRTILTDIQRATNTVVLATEQGTKGAEEGAKLAEQAGQAIRQLAETIRESAEAGRQIVAATGQQSAGMEQIGAAMASINQAMISASAGIRQIEKAAAVINELAQRQSGLLSRYQLNGRS